MSWETVLGYYTGLRILDPHLQADTLLPTALAAHAGDAVMCRLLAYNRRRGQNRWTLLGFVGGIWALVALLCLPPRTGRR